jgi:hypothetical protein
MSFMLSVTNGLYMLSVTILDVVMLIVIMLNVIMLSVVMLSGIMLNVVILSAVMLNVATPCKLQRKMFFLIHHLDI